GALVADARAALGSEKDRGVGAPGAKTAPGAESGAVRPPRDRQSPWRVPALLGAGAAAVIAVVVAAVLLSTGNGGKLGATSSTGASASTAALSSKDRVVRINPATRKVVLAIATGRDPSAVALGEGSVWVANSVDGTVSRIDPVGNKVTGVIP